jgi:hypothetical protein
MSLDLEVFVPFYLLKVILQLLVGGWVILTAERGENKSGPGGI